MPTKNSILLIGILLLFACSEEKEPQKKSELIQATKADTLLFNLVFEDSIGYGCRGMEIFEEEAYFSGIKGTCFKITKDYQTEFLVQLENDSLDFRDLQVIGRNKFYTINSGSNRGIIYKYTNDKFEKVYQAVHEGAFLDDLDLDEDGNIYCLGDPMPEDRSLFLLKSRNGKDWKRIYDYTILGEDEFFFAASGSCMDIYKDTIYLAVGGKRSYILSLMNDHPGILMDPSKIPAGESSGINAILNDSGIIYAVGGDYMKPNDPSITFEKFFSSDDYTAATQGYQSTIAKQGDLLVCSGRNGTYYSQDDGKSWNQFLKDEFYKVILNQNKLYCSGPKGKIKIFEIKNGRN